MSAKGQSPTLAFSSTINRSKPIFDGSNHKDLRNADDALRRYQGVDRGLLEESGRNPFRPEQDRGEGRRRLVDAHPSLGALAPLPRLLAELGIELCPQARSDAQPAHALGPLLDVGTEGGLVALAVEDDLAQKAHVAQRNRQA